MNTTHAARLANIGGVEVRRLMDTAVSYTRYCKANGMPEQAREHAARALAYAAELDRRAAAAAPVAVAVAA